MLGSAGQKKKNWGVFQAQFPLPRNSLLGATSAEKKQLACLFTRVSESAKHKKQTKKELKQRPEALRGPFDRGGEKVDKGGEKVAPDEKTF